MIANNNKLVINNRLFFFSSVGKDLLDVLNTTGAQYTTLSVSLTSPDLSSPAGQGVFVFTREDFTDPTSSSRLDNALRYKRALILINDHNIFSTMRFRSRNNPDVVIAPFTSGADILNAAQMWCPQRR